VRGLASTRVRVRARVRVRVRVWERPSSVTTDQSYMARAHRDGFRRGTERDKKQIPRKVFPQNCGEYLVPPRLSHARSNPPYAVLYRDEQRKPYRAIACQDSWWVVLSGGLPCRLLPVRPGKVRALLAEYTNCITSQRKTPTFVWVLHISHCRGGR